MRKKKIYQEMLPSISEIIGTQEIAESLKGKWYTLFDADNPIVLELGCGRGKYIVDQASSAPHYNYIGMEFTQDRTVQAYNKSKNIGLTNTRFIAGNFEQCENFFAPGEVARIVINCPEPQEKKRQEKHRVTYPLFLSWYEKFLSDDGELWLKTDHRRLFEYSLIHISKIFDIYFVSCDYHNSENTQIVGYSPEELEEAKKIYSDSITEYEAKWLAQGRKFFVLRARKRK